MPQKIQLVLALLSDGEGEEPEAAGEGTSMRAAKRHDESPATDELSMGGARLRAERGWEERSRGIPPIPIAPSMLGTHRKGERLPAPPG